MNNYLLTGLVVSIIYFLLRFIEMRINQDNRPLKELFRDALIVFLASASGGYILEQFNFSLTDNVKEVPNVFVNDPGF